MMQHGTVRRVECDSNAGGEMGLLRLGGDL